MPSCWYETSLYNIKSNINWWWVGTADNNGSLLRLHWTQAIFRILKFQWWGRQYKTYIQYRTYCSIASNNKKQKAKKISKEKMKEAGRDEGLGGRGCQKCWYDKPHSMESALRYALNLRNGRPDKKFLQSPITLALQY